MPSSKLGKSSITVRCTTYEHECIKKNAQQYGMELSEYVRFACLHAEISVKAEKPSK